jgi:hypothetical protein
MSNYTPVNDFSAKDALTTGDPEKIILGSDMDNETAAIQTAVNSKYDTNTTAITLTGNFQAATITATTGFVGGTLSATTGVFSSTIQGTTITATVGHVGPGSGLTSLTAANITAAGTLPQLNGAALTALNATNIASGSLADARLSANVPLINAGNTFTANQNVSHTGSTALQLTSTDVNPAYVVFQTNSASRGLIGASSGANVLITGSALGDLLVRSESGGVLFSGDAGSTSYLKLSSTGAVTTKNSVADEVGFKGAPPNTQTISYTGLLTDAGKLIVMNNTSLTFTIPANGSVAYPIGTVLVIANRHTTTLTISITTDSLVLAGVGTTGSRTLASNGTATAIKTDATVWLISGAGLS